MDNLYVDIYSLSKTLFEVSLESLIVIFVHKHCNSPLKLNFIFTKIPDSEPTFKIDINFINTYKIVKEIPKLVTYCELPLAIIDDVIVVSGLCSVSRQIIKSAPNDEDEVKKLLGFREACLKACNESSIWTKFCEIDMIYSIKDILQNSKEYFTNEYIKVPKDLSRFEYHMSQPVRLHNMYKVARDQAKLKEDKTKMCEINSNTPKIDLDLDHVYSEGPFMTLADMLLYPCIYIFASIFGKQIFKKYFPLVFKWYGHMTTFVNIPDVTLPDMYIFTPLHEGVLIKEDTIEKSSLYISDPHRYKPKNRIYTKQSDIINALNIINELNFKITIGDIPYGADVSFDWSKVPLEANPKGGALPASRMKRKSEQLENLAKAVIKVAKPGHTIVDFCSGSGHLGILLAVHLKDCHIILLDNKEKSLARAKERVMKLNLSNITLLQCNLDYFKSPFDIGTSLHACGGATDLVIQQCLRQNAMFICCPCCYGNVQNYHHITYPRSAIFKNSSLTLKDYLVLGHSADQTHDTENIKTQQGIECMNIIDTDRKLQAEEFGYKVFLSKMIPRTCTPKNNILVGIPDDNVA